MSSVIRVACYFTQRHTKLLAHLRVSEIQHTVERYVLANQLPIRKIDLIVIHFSKSGRWRISTVDTAESRLSVSMIRPNVPFVRGPRSVQTVRLLVAIHSHAHSLTSRLRTWLQSECIAHPYRIVNVTLRPKTACEPDRISAQVLPRLRVIVPVEVVM